MDIHEAINKISEMYFEDQNSWKVDSDNASFIQAHTNQIKAIVQQFGCIDINRFGEEVSHYAWLLVQHSNHDINFQKYYLSLMLESNDVLKRDIAFLTDRIAILEAKPQIYGTQFDPKTKDSEYSPFPILDEAQLDERRKSMGLEPMGEYREWMRSRLFTT